MKTYTKRLFNCYPPPTTHTHNDRKYNLNIVTLGDILLCFAGAEKKHQKDMFIIFEIKNKIFSSNNDMNAFTRAMENQMFQIV